MIINICKIMYKKQMHILNDDIFGENADYYDNVFNKLLYF